MMTADELKRAADLAHDRELACPDPGEATTTNERERREEAKREARALYIQVHQAASQMRNLERKAALQPEVTDEWRARLLGARDQLLGDLEEARERLEEARSRHNIGPSVRPVERHLAEVQAALHAIDHWRCLKCGEVHFEEALETEETWDGEVRVCPCGGDVDPPGWRWPHGFALPQVPQLLKEKIEADWTQMQTLQQTERIIEQREARRTAILKRVRPALEALGIDAEEAA